MTLWVRSLHGADINKSKPIHMIKFVETSTVSVVETIGLHGPQTYTRVIPQSEKPKKSGKVSLLSKIKIYKLTNFLLNDIESKQYTSELMPDGIVKCGKTTIDQFGWVRGQKLAILGCSCLLVSQDFHNMKLSFVGLIRTDSKGFPVKLLHTFIGFYDAVRYTEDRNLYSVEHVTNLDSDAEYEVVVENIRYAGSMESIVDIESDDTVSVETIHSDAWD